MKLHRRRAVKSRKKRENAGKQWEHRREDPTYIDGRSKQGFENLLKDYLNVRKWLKQLLKKKKNLVVVEKTPLAYKFISQKRKVQKKQEREKRALIESKRSK